MVEHCKMDTLNAHCSGRIKEQTKVVSVCGRVKSPDTSVYLVVVDGQTCKTPTPQGIRWWLCLWNGQRLLGAVWMCGLREVMEREKWKEFGYIWVDKDKILKW